MTLSDTDLALIAAAADTGALPLPATVARLCRELLLARRVAREAGTTVVDLARALEMSLAQMRREVLQ